MTTIACNLREIAGDSHIVFEGVGRDTVGGVKIYTGSDSLYGVAGENCDGSIIALEWLMAGAPKDFRPAYPGDDSDWYILALTPNGIGVYNTLLEMERITDPICAIGSGRKVAMYCMKILGMSPGQAVSEACKIDAWSRPPVYSAQIHDRIIAKFTGVVKQKGRKTAVGK